jgi:hypothetical protein
MTRTEIESWAAAYIRAQQDPTILEDDHPFWWAIENFMFNSDGPSAEDCWLAILEVLSRNPPKHVLGMLAAGPLEDLIEYCGPDFIERIELESLCNPAFRDLLGGVWESSTPEVWARIEKTQQKLL